MTIVADSSFEADVTAEASVEAELGVEAASRLSQLLSTERRGRVLVAGGSMVLEKVLRMVGETALKVSSRKLVDFLPNTQFCFVSRRSLGRCERAGVRCNMGRVVMVVC
jgi:hypothetical protein